jgi:Cd2+/Zn2+-exporting ATPase
MQALNIELIMLTGDRKAAHYVANTVGVKSIWGFTSGKQIGWALLKEYGSVAMVGDSYKRCTGTGIGTVGIAMGAAGSDTAIDANMPWWTTSFPSSVSDSSAKKRC